MSGLRKCCATGRFWEGLMSPRRRVLKSPMVGWVSLVGIVAAALLATITVLGTAQHRPSLASRSHVDRSPTTPDRPGGRSPWTSAMQIVSPQGTGSGLQTTSSDGLPTDCIPNPTGPPGAPYELGLVGTVQGGVLSTGSATVADIDATFCAVVTIVGGTPPCGATGSVDSPQDGQIFGALSVDLTLVPGMSPSLGFVAHPGTITGGFACEQSDNGLLVDLDATVTGTTSPVFGVSCTIGPVTIPLTGLVTGPLTNLSATLTSTDFSVPAVASSPTCPANIPANVDAIAGLPLQPGQGEVTLPVTASLYQPAPT